MNGRDSLPFDPGQRPWDVDSSHLREGNPHQRTALHFAAEAGQLAAVELLISRNATVDILDAADTTPLRLAKIAGYTAVVAALKVHC